MARPTTEEAEAWRVELVEALVRLHREWRRPVTVSEVAEATGLPRQTAGGRLAVAASEGSVIHHESLRAYSAARLGDEVFTWALVSVPAPR